MKYINNDFFSSTETFVHPTTLLGEEVKLEKNVKIGPFCIITGNVTIGAGSRVYSHSVIGLPAQDLGTTQSLGTITIGENCHIREFVSIHASKKQDGTTIIGNNCYIMNYCHVAHDAILEDNVVLINNVSLAGHTYIERNVMLMANTAVHQFCRIGKFSCLTPFSATRQDLPPFSMFTGQPGQFSGLNRVALKRAQFSQDSIDALKHVAKLFYQDKLMLPQIHEQTRLPEQAWGNDEHVKTFLNFIEASKRGVSRRILSYGKEVYY